MKLAISTILFAAASSVTNAESLRGLRPAPYRRVFGDIDLCNDGEFNKCEITAVCPEGYKLQDSGFSLLDCSTAESPNSSNCNAFTGIIWSFKLGGKALVFDGPGSPAIGVTYKGTAEDPNVAIRPILSCELMAYE